MFLLGDVGGTKTRIALSKNLKDIDEIFIFETKGKYKDFLKVIEKFRERKIRKARLARLDTRQNARQDARQACFGFAGNFDKKKEKLIYTPNLKDYEGRNLKKDLERILKCKVILENDAVLAGLGESYFGAGKNYKIFFYLTFSSGIGGAKIVNYKIDDNIFGFEPGHSLFFLNWEEDKTLIFEVEDLIGGKSLEEVFKQRLEEIQDKKFWREITKLYALFLVNVSLFWSTEVIIIGGGISKKLDLKVLNKNFQSFHPLGWKVKILRSKLKNLSGIYGGLAMLKYEKI
jgi:predicted NBD/HSP70 family sugar kinase